MSRRVVVTGLGVVSSLGCELEEFWFNLIKGTSGISEVTAFDTTKLERHYGGQVKKIPFSSQPRTAQFALSACQQALRDANIEDARETGLTLGCIAGGGEVIEGRDKDFNNYPVCAITSTVCKALGLQGSAFTLSCACGAGNYAISLGYDRIKSGDEEIILAAGADYFSLFAFVGFHRLYSIAARQCQPFDKNRQGLIPAEGAGVLVLEELSSAQKRGAHIYAEILGYGMSSDASHSVIPSDEGILYCMKNALETSGLGISDVDYISAHGTGTIPNDKLECKAIKELFGSDNYKKIPVSSIKSMLGHAMGAASSLEAISCCLALERGIIPPTVNFQTPDPECDIDCVPNEARKQKINTALNNSFGFGGMNCSVAFSRYKV